MPQPPTLSLSNYLNSVSSSSRKRSHAEITRSQSRSTSPVLPSKRRRIGSSMPSSRHPPSPTPSQSISSTRFEGDGYDFRRPVMSQPRSHPSRNPSSTAIDLTLDSDSSTESDTQPQPSHPRRRHATREIQSERDSRASSLFVQQNQGEDSHEIIDLSDDSDFQIEEFQPVGNRRPTPFRQSSSPDVEFVRERLAQPSSRRASPPRRVPSVPVTDRGPFGYFPEILRRSTQFMFDNVANAWQAGLAPDPRDPLRDFNQHMRQDNRRNPAQNLVINLDYQQPGFTLGGFDMYERSSETPQVVQEPYKAPQAPKEGFIRSFAEDSVVLCPMCGDELAFGADDTKQQVWVVKCCGHVYCGECATNRHITKANKKDKKAVSTRSIPFKICAVEGCNSKVSSRAAMFPIYL